MATPPFRKLATLGAATTAALLAAGCLVAPFQPPTGIVSVYRAPLDLDMAQTPVATKEGQASAHCVLGLVAWGDASAHAAAANGHLKTIHSADYDYLNILGLYQKTTVIVQGE
ncbi:MAG: TRL domain-containing protein [Lentisphaeria bacterium]|jgi:hypothetical protein